MKGSATGSPIELKLTAGDLARATAMVQGVLASEFGAGLVASPALEMLLDLHLSQNDRPRSLTALTAVSHASDRNAQRIVYRMADLGLMHLWRDPTDGRRVLVALAPTARANLDAAFDRMVDFLAMQGQAASSTDMEGNGK